MRIKTSHEESGQTPLSLTITSKLLECLMAHLFPGDQDEHGAVIACGIVETKRGTRLLARELFLARDGMDYVPGHYGHRALTPAFIARVSDYCADERLCYLAVHNHGGNDSVGFSGVDLASHERGYPALLDITNGGPVGALVFAKSAVAGDIWTPQGCRALDYMTVLGPRIYRLYPSPPARPRHADLVYDRHVRLFGDAGQEILRSLKVGIIGLGGGGSLLSEWLSRLGVGHVVAVDFDGVDITNRPRIAGATQWDAMEPLVRSRFPWLRNLGCRLAHRKVDVARRVARQANPAIRYDAIPGDVVDQETAKLLRDADFLFLATDSMQSRLVFNALVQQYLIPGAQIGVKAMVEKDCRQIGDVFAATRLVLPGAGSGCLECHGLISAAALQEESLSEGERRAQRYVEDEEVPEPSVITLNALSAAQAANDLLFLFTGLYDEGVELKHQIHFARERLLSTVDFCSREECLDCGTLRRSRYARGDRGRLPCRMTAR